MSDYWRYIDSGLSSASYNMAVDEAIAISVKKGDSPPTLRLYGWSIPSVSIGYSQKVSDIDFDYCKKKGIPIVRRPTGGRAILHSNEITYSFSVKTDDVLFSKNLRDSYRKISKAFVVFFLKIGLSPDVRLLRETRHSRSPLCFESVSYGEITIKDKKIIGSAQKRWNDGLLQQGSIPISIDREEMERVFRLQSPIEGRLVGLKEIIHQLNYEVLKNIIKDSFEEVFDKALLKLPLSKEETSLAMELESKKYLSPDWNFMR
ncbi:MAG: lipoate--protein ligase family protein [Thermodesulfovibrionales bacterium]